MNLNPVLPEIEWAGKKLAVQTSIRGLLNSFFRETGIFDIRSEKGRFLVELPHSKRSISGQLVHFSATGQHSYGESFLAAEKGDTRFQPIDPERLISIILEEVGYCEGEADRRRRITELNRQIKNSMLKMGRYFSKAMAEPDGRFQPDYIRSEQTLLAGHPFHPTPKNAEGFTEEELQKYAPELRASFQLHYFAVHTSRIKEERLEEYGDAIPLSVRREASARLGNQDGQFRLLPLHPWQADYVKRFRSVQQMLSKKELLDLGPLGRPVFPTSSVRTVWLPEESYFFKLPLHVRITNFIRENSAEQVRRTMDAAKIMKSLHVFDRTDGFQVLPETGFLTVNLDDCANEQSLQDSYSVVFRKAEQLAADGAKNCYVVASLLECFPGEHEPKLMQAIRHSSEGEMPDPSEWLAAFLKLSLLPLLQLFADKGISLEAHVQNSLIKLESGLPASFYVRDLEGVSIVREIAERAGWSDSTVEAGSPVFYPEEEAWMRLAYYFVVNHLSAVVHALAIGYVIEELKLWDVVRRFLIYYRESMSSDAGRLRALIDDLLENAVLPAKANLISYFREHGETPAYVNIPNPIFRCKEEL